MKKEREQYLRCPYCFFHVSTEDHRRVPKTVGVYRITMIHGNIFTMKCLRCRKIIKVLISDVIKWENASDKERMKFKLTGKKQNKQIIDQSSDKWSNQI